MVEQRMPQHVDEVTEDHPLQDKERQVPDDKSKALLVRQRLCTGESTVSYGSRLWTSRDIRIVTCDAVMCC